MSKAASAAVLKVQAFNKNKWTTSEIVARQGAGVFLGGHRKDIEPGNPLYRKMSNKEIAKKIKKAKC